MSVARVLFLSLAILPIAPGTAQSQTASGRECLALAAGPLDQSSEAARDKSLKTWRDTCQQALAAKPDNPHIKVALWHAVWLMDGREAALPLLREAAAQNDPEALLAIFNDFNSFDRNLNKPDLIPRAEAQQALYRAAELGNPDAIWRLTTILPRGGPLKHDLAAARLWGERALANPPKDMRRSDIQVGVGSLLSKSDNADERRRGISMLEALPNRGDAQAFLAEAIRSSDPVRARALLETALRTYPGHALAPLADMLIKGEGGPKDERRALSLLQGRQAIDAQLPRPAYAGRPPGAPRRRPGGETARALVAMGLRHALTDHPAAGGKPANPARIPGSFSLHRHRDGRAG